MEPPAKTYSHLAHARRMPSDYELTTSDLLYYPPKGGFEVNTPLAAFYERHQRGCALQSPNWERFADPRETTYFTYTRLQAAKEAYVGGLLRSIDESAYDRELAAPWRDSLDRLLSPLRYPWHGFQMAAAYLGQMAPSGRITVAALFQAADELRRIQGVAYRMAQLRQVDPAFGRRAKADWQDQPHWQPLRRAVERLLVTFDWGEAFAALCLCLKPVLDQLALVELPALAKREDYFLGEIFRSFEEDSRWHRDWAASLVRTAIEDRPQNRAVLERWIGAWLPVALEAAGGLAPLFGAAGDAAIAGAMDRTSNWLRSLELRVEGG